MDANEALQTSRHSAAHIMAAVIQKLWPDVKFDIGPATADGFYYDFDMEHHLVPEDLKTIETAMRKMIGQNKMIILIQNTLLQIKSRW